MLCSTDANHLALDADDVVRTFLGACGKNLRHDFLVSKNILISAVASLRVVAKFNSASLLETIPRIEFLKSSSVVTWACNWRSQHVWRNKCERRSIWDNCQLKKWTRNYHARMVIAPIAKNTIYVIYIHNIYIHICYPPAFWMTWHVHNCDMELRTKSKQLFYIFRNYHK